MKRTSLIIATILTICFFSAKLYAQTDNVVTLGGVEANNQLKIEIFKNGRFNVTRYTNGWVQQFFDNENTPIFAIKIGTIIYSYKGHGSVIGHATLNAFDSIEDIGLSNTTGTQHEMTKRFTGTYLGSTFTVTIKIMYNTTTPDFFIKTATIDATNIPDGTPIILAYGFDTYLANNDAGFAYILPDIFSLNISASPADRYPTTAQVQSVRLVGARNSVTDNTVIGYFPVGRSFDRAWSANPYQPGYSYNMLALSPGSGGSSGTDAQYKFRFGNYGNAVFPKDDNGTGVGYDNIPAGQITEISTGLTFSEAISGELDYFWNGVKNYAANVGDNVTLDLNYTCHSPVILTNVGFQVDHTGLQISDVCTSSGFTGGTSNCTFGNEFYQLSGASVAAMGSGAVSIPVNIVRAGKWVIDGNSISNMTETLPLGSPAILTVNTTVSLSDNSTVVLSVDNNSHLFTVKFPDTVVANEDVTVNINYSGDIFDFSSLPSSVIIPAGQNSATFTVTAASDATNGSSITVILSGTDKEFATIAPFDSVVVNYLNLPAPSCNSCPSSFAPIPGKKYIFSGWVKDSEALEIGAVTYENCFTALVFDLVGTNDKLIKEIYPSGSIIDGWQRIQDVIDVPENAYRMSLELKTTSGADVFFDDIRVYPFNGNMKSYVYDPVTRRLAAELDAENYATIYEYDEEGSLIRVKKETERGVMTIREARQGQRKQP